METMLDQTIKAYPEMPAGAWWLPRRYGGSAPTMEEAQALDEAEQLERTARHAARRRSQA
jgi:hypothetical protein